MKKVLIIDDDEALLLLLQNELTEAGLTVHATADGPDGIRIFREVGFDLVLLDLGLPSLNGIEVLRELRKIDSEAKVIIVSAYNSDRFKAEASEAGAVGFIDKPIHLEELFELVQSNLQGCRFS